MPGEDWYKAKEEWCDPDRPFDPSWNVPPKKSVDIPKWKIPEQYREKEEKPINVHG